MEYPFKDLLPLDEVLEREGYYKDWTHLDPEVFYSLTQISEYIKTKGYGVDVRLLIAQLAEHFGLRVTQITDAMNEFNDLKPKAELSISQSAEALSKSQNALNVANGIDAKATTALSLSKSADTLSKSVQEQFNQVVIDGDSSVEASQARVDVNGVAKPTLKQRLDDDYTAVTTQLEHKSSRNYGAKKKEPMVVFLDDDGHRDVYTKLKPIFEEHNVPCSLAIITGRLDTTSYSMSKNQVRELSSMGWELLGHTHDAHSPNMSVVSLEYLSNDLATNKKKLEELGSVSKGFVYPQSVHNNDIQRITQEHFSFAFGGVGINDDDFIDAMMIRRIAFGAYTQEGDTFEYYTSLVDDIFNSGTGLLVFMLHVGDTPQIQLDMLSPLINHIKSKNIPIVNASEAYEEYGPDIWMGINGEGEDFMAVTKKTIYSNNLLPNVMLPLNARKPDDGPSTFQSNAITYTKMNSVFANAQGYPENRAGTRVTYILDKEYHAYNFEEYHVYNRNRVYRRIGVGSNGWSEWELVSKDVIEYFVNTITAEMLPEDFPDQSKQIYSAGGTYMTASNFPTNSAATIEVTRSGTVAVGGMTEQKIITNNSVMYRFGVNNSWGTWKRLTLTDV